MDESPSNPNEREEDAFELGDLLGRRKAFGAIAGRCSAADIECMRRIRDRKLYLNRAATWEEFCPQYLGISKTHVNRTIRILEELGPDYFALAQLTHITPKEFRAISPAVKDHEIVIRGEAIALIEGNVGRVAAAVAELRKTGAPVRAEAPKQEPFDLRCRRLVSEFLAISGDAPAEGGRERLISTLNEMREILE